MPIGAVVRGEQPGELLALELQAAAQVDLEAAVHGGLRRPQRHRRTAHVTSRPGHGLVVDRIRRDHERPPVRCASASSAFTWRPEKIISLARAGPTSRGRRCVPPAPGMMPKLDLRQAEFGVVGAHPEVTAQRQFQATAEGVAGDRGDRGLADLGDGGERRLQGRGALDRRLVVPVGHLLDVGARPRTPSGRRTPRARPRRGAGRPPGRPLRSAAAPPRTARSWAAAASVSTPTPSTTSRVTYCVPPVPSSPTSVSFVHDGRLTSHTDLAVGRSVDRRNMRTPEGLPPMGFRPDPDNPGGATVNHFAPAAQQCDPRVPGVRHHVDLAPGPYGHWTAELPDPAHRHHLRIPGDRTLGAGVRPAAATRPNSCSTRTPWPSPASSRSTTRSTPTRCRIRT